MAPVKKSKKSKSGSRWTAANTLPLVIAVSLSLFVVYRLPILDVTHGHVNVHDAAAALSSAGAIHPSSSGALVDLLRTQNATIAALRERLEAASSSSSSSATPSANEARLFGQLEAANGELDHMKAKLVELTSRVQVMTAEGGLLKAAGTAAPPLPPPPSPPPPPPASSSGGKRVDLPRLLRTKLDEDCEARFGLGLADRWRESKEEWCSPAGGDRGGPLAASIHCYPYTQEHKKNPGGRRSGTDMFCEGRNILVDFSKVHGEHGKSKPRLGAQYLGFSGGATASTCKPTKAFGRVGFMPHMALQMGGARGGGGGGAGFQHSLSALPSAYERVAGSTYLLARDEDCENMFHSSADHLNLYLVSRILGLDFKTLQVVLFDRHFDGPFHDLIQTAFSPSKPLKRAAHYRQQQQKSGAKGILFEHLVWHLESPAGIVFPKVGGGRGLMRCRRSSLWEDFRAHVLRSFDLLDVPPPPVPTALLSYRRRTDAKNVGRVFQDEKALEAVLKEGNMMSFTAIDLGSVPFRKQLEIVRNSNIFIGAHGAGLMHVMFMAEEGVLVEIHPSYRLDRHFRLASRMSGKIYLPMRTTGQVSCRGSSDAIPVDKDEFRRTLDAAVRIARSFDDGASECGLKCDPRILAIDTGNDAHYDRTDTKKGRPLSTQFPCH